MKKIKGILLFGILTLLGFGSSFGYNGMMHYIDFQNYSSNKSWSINAGNTTSPIAYFTTATDSTYYTTFLRKTSSSNLFDISTYELSSHFSANYLGQRPFYFDTNGNRFATVNYSSNSSYGTYLIPITSSFGSLSVSDNLLNNTSQGIYARIFSSQNSCFSNYALTYSGSLCTPDFVQIFAHNKYTITSIGNNYDSQVDGVNYYKGGVSPSIDKGYSFAFVDGNGRYSSGNNYYLSGNFHLKSILYSGSNVTSLNNILLFRLNNNSPVPSTGTDNYQVIALALTSPITGGYYPIVYSIYSCPYNSNTIYQCSFVEGGTTNRGFVTQFSDSSSAWNNLTFFLTKDYGGKMYNSYSSANSTLKLYRYVESASNQWVGSPVSQTISLDPSAGYNIIQNIPSEGGQSSGSMAINTGLINLCLTSPSFYDLNTIFCNHVFGGRDLTYIQGLISSGAYLQSYVDGSGNLVYVVDITDEPGVLTGSVSWECYGDRCINTESGSWGDVEPWEILHLSGGDILSSGYYLGFFESINETGYFFKCPYSYNNSRWIAGKSILNAIGRDPFLPINCFIAAYENGRRVNLFDEAFNGYSWGPLMNGDTQNHKNLFTFFDILLSVALIFFLMKFYHLFK